MKTTRRSFLKASLVMPMVMPLSFSWAKTTANDRIRVGFIGMGRQNRGLLKNFMYRTQVVAVCDVDTTRREDALKKANEFYSKNPKYGKPICKAYVDFEDIVARDDIDAICIATPDHWHAMQTIASLRTGKDVYCEKPLTHDISESVEVMKEVAANKRVLQTGSWQRSKSEFRIACELVRNRVAGEILHINSGFSGPPRPCDLPGEPMEPGLDWNRWVGPAPIRPYNSALSPRGMHKHFPAWRRYTEFGGGGVADMGAHHLDIIQWALDMDNSGPVKVLAVKKDNATNGASLVYANGVKVNHRGGTAVDVVCANGRIQVNRSSFNFVLDGKTIAKFTRRQDGGSLRQALAIAEKQCLKNAKIRLEKIDNHVENFLDCMRSRKKPLASDIVGSRSAICCHLLNMTYAHQQDIKWDPEKCAFADGSGNTKWLTGSRRDYKKDIV